MILRRLEGSRLSEIVRVWQGETFVVLGGGPSLTREQVSLVGDAHAAGRVRCIAVNDAFLLADFADLLYAADALWHHDRAAGKGPPALKMDPAEVRARYEAFADRRCSVEDQVYRPRTNESGIRDERVHILGTGYFPIQAAYAAHCGGELIAGRNGSHQALNFGVMAGGARALLVAVDAKRGPNERTHWHGGHGKPLDDQFFAQMRMSFAMAENPLKARGIEVLNCSPDSAIGSFPKVSLADALERSLA